MTRQEIYAERRALKRANKLFLLSVISVTAVAAFVLYSTVGRLAGEALKRCLQ